MRAVAMRQSRADPPGALVGLYGRRLHVQVTGTGAVTALLDGEDGFGTRAWESVASEMGGEVRVVRYDRPGHGWSDPAPLTPTADENAQDLHAALAHLGIAGPYVAVGHGFGANVMRLFAHRYRREVSGLVLIDAPPPGFTALAAGSTPVARRASRRWRFPWSRDDAAVLDESEREVASLPGLGDLPLVVVYRDRPGPATGRRTKDAARAAEVWRRLQGELAASSTRGRSWVATGVGSDVPRERPDLVAAAVRAVASEAEGTEPST